MKQTLDTSQFDKIKNKEQRVIDFSENFDQTAKGEREEEIWVKINVWLPEHKKDIIY